MTASAKVTAYPAERSPRAVGCWLAVVAAMVAVMTVIGAVTRLTESGLSMVEWRPLFGALPPLSEAEWERVFALYRQTSQYRLQNLGMSLAEFQNIFWWEYIHRLWGRVIGVAYGIPLVFFLWRGMVRRPLRGHLLALLLLGALQAVIGWWMVASGFVDRTDVSQYRLTVHLGLAVVILGYLLWLVLDIFDPRVAAGTPHLNRAASAVAAFVFATILSGALVAGTDAGMVHNLWPMMHGGIWPEDGGELSPWWLNMFENRATIQFDHRLMAYLTIAATAGLAVAVFRSTTAAAARLPAALAAVAAVAQAAIGVMTLLLVVPLPLAVLHQAGAMTLFCLAVWTAHRLVPAR